VSVESIIVHVRSAIPIAAERRIETWLEDNNNLPIFTSKQYR